MPIYRLSHELVFPDPLSAEDDGLLAVGGDLSPERLVLAYANGIFPWYSEGRPILWWSPDPRCVLWPQALVVGRSLRKTLRRGPYQVTFDRAFDQVIAACAAVPRPGQDGTWITRDMQRAYGRLHRLGVAHSVEAWLDGELVGGLYGVSLGTVFFGESMFAHRPDASKVAFVTLVQHLVAWGFTMVDCQLVTEHLLRFGACTIPLADFLSQLQGAVKGPSKRGPWQVELATT